ncbi:MAG: TIGR00282 family metallophosphoesterase [Bacilli bacterium]|nr:TIGR00282 family metallophosphoesterase [Bacilli bacterium]
MKILFIGDIVGKIGRRIVKDKIQYYVEKYDIDFVIANGENATHGKGLNYNHYRELIDSGIDAITLGNHYDSKSEIRHYIDRVDRLIRPCNLIKPFPGEGSIIFDIDGITVRVVNILGSAFINEEVNNPYYAMLDILSEEEATITIVDYHGEATAEKMGFARAFDGKVSAVLGTHTHVQTSDARILPNGTAFISDVGMCGEYDSVLGFETESVVNKTVYGHESKFALHDQGKGLFSAVVIDIDDYSGLAKDIFSIYYVEED